MPPSKLIKGVNDLATKHPEIAGEWHSSKNTKLTPSDITYGSKKKVWWQCPKEKDHIYDQTINVRTSRGLGCPYCSGQRVHQSNSLATLSPDVAKEWHSTRNKGLTPNDFTNGSSQKVWWQCPKNNDHVWDAPISDRTYKNSGCPFCAGRRVHQSNSLATLSPDVAKEWHPIKNGDLIPSDITYGSKRKVWWQCPKEKDHIYDLTINARTSQGQSCPFCAGRRVHQSNSLATLSPDVAKEWHPTLNDGFTPNDFTNGSSQKVWWQCPKNKDHFWDAIISDRTGRVKSGCPFCNEVNQSSRPEMRILSELRSVFRNVISRKKLKKIEFDIYLPDLKVGIEFDGSFYHKDRKKQDLNKNKFADIEEIVLIRLREEPLCKILENDLIIKAKGLDKNDINNLLNLIQEVRTIERNQLLMNIDEYIKNSDFINQELYQIYIKNFPAPLPENSLEKLFPEISKEWFKEKNYPLLPLDFSAGSNQKIWWQCPKNKDHIYDQTINARTAQGQSCPYCSGHRVHQSNSLATLSPDVAKEWHPTLNDGFTPNDFTNGSSQKVWWQCPKNKDHFWDSIISDRTNGKGCPFCAGRRVHQSNSLATLSPDVAKEWHPTLNAPLTADNVTNRSGKRVWWQCSKNKDHIWDTDIKTRTRQNGTGCPYCSGRKTI